MKNRTKNSSLLLMPRSALATAAGPADAAAPDFAEPRHYGAGVPAADLELAVANYYHDGTVSVLINITRGRHAGP